MCKFIVVTGGVVSSLGKGVAASSIAALLQAHGYSVRLKKLDPYLNVDPGTMSPYQHGEVFVTSDGYETDLDLGYYERFTGNNVTKFDTTTSGKLYETLIEKERKGEYLGNTVQTIPHFTDLIKDFIKFGQDECDFMICELGGTVGDIEALPYLEAVRQLQYEVGSENFMSIHLTLLPYIATAGGLKTKPTQHSVKELRSIGIQPDMIICRADREIMPDLLRKIVITCGIKEANVIEGADKTTIYHAPLGYHKNEVDKKILKHFKLEYNSDIDLTKWHWIEKRLNNHETEVRIAIVGKYNKFEDAYKSLIESFLHAGIHNKCKVLLHFVNADDISGVTLAETLKDVDGIMIPGGFGARGMEGKMHAITYAREQKKPAFGICLGMQLMAIEFARNVLGITDANSTEFSQHCSNVVDRATNWVNQAVIETRNNSDNLGGTMRLGNYKISPNKDSKIGTIYENRIIEERHRHRFKFNTNYCEQFEKAGMQMGSFALDASSVVESIEIKDHPWFIGVQFHPEYNSKPFAPHPLFMSFVQTLISLK